MPRHFVAAPVEGVLTQHKPKKYDQAVAARLFVEGVVLEPGDAPIPGSTTLGQLKKRYRNELTRSLLVRIGNHVFTITPEQLGDLSDSTEISLALRYLPA